MYKRNAYIETTLNCGSLFWILILCFSFHMQVHMLLSGRVWPQLVHNHLQIQE